MSFCDKCGKPLPKDGQFCIYCGAEVSTGIETAPGNSPFHPAADLDSQPASILQPGNNDFYFPGDIGSSEVRSEKPCPPSRQPEPEAPPKTETSASSAPCEEKTAANLRTERSAAPAEKKSHKKRILTISAVGIAVAACVAAALIFIIPKMQPAAEPAISEADAEKMLALIDDIADMDAQGTNAEEIYAYLDALDWITDIRYEDDGGISCRTAFGVTAVWNQEKDGYISSSSAFDEKFTEDELQIVEKFAGDGLDIVILCPYASVDDDFILDGYEDMANKLAEKTSGSVTVLKDGAVSLERLKSIDEFDMVFFYSHGCLSSMFNSAWAVFPSDPYTMTGEFADRPASYVALSSDFYCGRTVINLSTGRIGIGGNFYTHYYENGDLEKMFFHFGSCYSMHTSTISDALLSLGAAWVEGWSDGVEFDNDFLHMYGMGASLLCGYSAEDSVRFVLSDAECQKEAQSDCSFVTAGDGAYQITTNTTEQEIIDAYKEACNFYGKWVDGGGHAWRGPSDDYVETYELGNVSSYSTDYFEKHCRTYDDEITTVAQLKDGLYSRFNSEYAEEFFKRLDPIEDNGKLFTYYGGGWGADWECVDKIESIEKTGDHSYVLTVSGNSSGERLYGRIACECKDRQYHFYPLVEYLYDEDGNNSYPGEFAFYLASDADLNLHTEEPHTSESTEPSTSQPEASESVGNVTGMSYEEARNIYLDYFRSIDLESLRVSFSPYTDETVQVFDFEYCSKEDYKIQSMLADIGNDGSYELLLIVGNPKLTGPAGYPVCSLLFAIHDGKVEQVLDSYFSGGTAGGGNLSVVFDTVTERHLIATESHGRDGMSYGISTFTVFDCIDQRYTEAEVLTSEGINLDDQFYQEEAEKIRGENPYAMEEDGYLKYFRWNDAYISKSVYEEQCNRYIAPTDDRYNLKDASLENLIP